jgi:small conductance mechanosensitive channel
MLQFVLTQDLADQVTEVVSDNVTLWSWDMIVQYLQDSLPTILDFLVKLIIAIIVLLVGRKVIKIAREFFRKFLEKTPWEEGAKQFFDHAFGVLLHFVLIMIVLGKFGITASSVIAVIGSVGLSIGLALQGSLANFAGGVLILMLKPFKVGDYIVEDSHGNEGTVTEIQLFYTKLLTLDNRTVILPNGDLSNTSLTNVTQQDKRMVQIKVGISYHADIRKAKSVLETVVANEQKRLPDEPYQVYVDSLEDSSVSLGIRVWTKSEDYWDVRWRLTENVKYAFDENDIEIPFPQVEVTMNS